MPVFLDQLAVSAHLKELLAVFLHLFPVYEYIVEQYIAITLTCLGLIFIDVVFFGKNTSCLVVNKIWKTCVGVLTILLYPVAYRVVNHYLLKNIIEPAQVVERCKTESETVLEIIQCEIEPNEDFVYSICQFSSASRKTHMDDIDEESGVWTFGNGSGIGGSDYAGYTQSPFTPDSETSVSYVTAADDTDSSGSQHKRDVALPGFAEMNSYEKIRDWSCPPIERRRSHPHLASLEDQLDSDLGFVEQFYLSHPQLNTI